ncbi:MAG: GNAT family N-acetyltransferase [Candidatus Sericytochromatia bacterium]
MEITFRKATKEDTEEILPLMYSAAEDLFEFSYTVSGKNVKDFLRYVLSKGKGYYGYQNQTVGVYNNQIVISGTTYKGKDILKETLDTFALIFSFYGFIGSLPVIYRSIVLSKIFISPKSDSLYIGNLGTKPEFRSKGIASKFFELIHEKAKKEDINRCELDVSLKNPRAENLYVRLGYVITKNLPYNGKYKLIGMKRMEKIL